ATPTWTMMSPSRYSFSSATRSPRPKAADSIRHFPSVPMPLARKTTVKEYENGAWPGTDVCLLEESGYLDLYVSADDGSSYRAHRCAPVEEAAALAAAFYAHLEEPLCPECGECSCGFENCPVDLMRCSCTRV